MKKEIEKEPCLLMKNEEGRKDDFFNL